MGIVGIAGIAAAVAGVVGVVGVGMQRMDEDEDEEEEGEEDIEAEGRRRMRMFVVVAVVVGGVDVVEGVGIVARELAWAARAPAQAVQGVGRRRSWAVGQPCGSGCCCHHSGSS